MATRVIAKMPDCNYLDDVDEKFKQLYRKWAGKPILIGDAKTIEEIGDPGCGTDVGFSVIEPDFVKEAEDLGDHSDHYICRHMIEAGD